jgi:central glycolytic genes regulator
MEKMLPGLKKIAPEVIDLSEKRYTILRSILYLQPIGRRKLSEHSGWAERMVRRETEFLKNQGLILVEPYGMAITSEGEEILNQLEQFIHHLRGLNSLKHRLREILQLDELFVVPGDAEDDGLVLKEMGRVAAQYIRTVISDGDVMAVTGGTTIAEVAKAFPIVNTMANVLVLPARGGMGKDVETQAGTIAAGFAKKLGGHHRLLHIPDNLGRRAMDTLAKEPDIQGVIENLRNARILVHGIGRACEMARKRNIGEKQIRMLKKREAVAEAFGYYFNRKGEIVYHTSSVGVDSHHLRRIPIIIGVAGGRKKAEAIMAVANYLKSSILVTDEGAARRILEIAGLEE